jgi:Ca-activated chloride channel family protein
MLVIDTSSSMAPRLSLVQAAAINMLHTMRPADRAAVVLFDEHVRIASPLSGDTANLEAAVRSAAPGGATALYEALYIALRELVRVRHDDGELRRQAIVVLSDGADNKSRIEFDHLLEEARSRNATIFTILPLPDPLADQMNSSTLFEMRRLAEDTGGRAFTPTALSDLAGAYADIANELQQQYWLAFVPAADSSGGFKHLSVRTEGHLGLRARSRSGYYGKPQRPGVPAAVAPRSAAEAVAAVPEVHSPRD